MSSRHTTGSWSRRSPRTPDHPTTGDGARSPKLHRSRTNIMIKIAHLYGVEDAFPNSTTPGTGAPGTPGAGTQSRGAPNHGAARPASRGTPTHRVPSHREPTLREPSHWVPIQGLPSQRLPSHRPPHQQAAVSRHPGLTREQVFRLWQCAIKDDDQLVDEIIERIYENIVAFDCKRAESVIELIVRRSITARWAFRSLLNDMRAC